MRESIKQRLLLYTHWLDGQPRNGKEWVLLFFSMLRLACIGNAILALFFLYGTAGAGEAAPFPSVVQSLSRVLLGMSLLLTSAIGAKLCKKGIRRVRRIPNHTMKEKRRFFKKAA